MKVREHKLPPEQVEKNRLYSARRKARLNGAPLPALPGEPQISYSGGDPWLAALGAWKHGNYFLEEVLPNNRLELKKVARGGNTTIERCCQDCGSTAPRSGFAPVFEEWERVSRYTPVALTLLCNACYDRRCWEVEF